MTEENNPAENSDGNLPSDQPDDSVKKPIEDASNEKKPDDMWKYIAEYGREPSSTDAGAKDIGNDYLVLKANFDKKNAVEASNAKEPALPKDVTPPKHRFIFGDSVNSNQGNTTPRYRQPTTPPSGKPPMPPANTPTPPIPPKPPISSTPLNEDEPDGLFDISKRDFNTLVRYHPDYETRNRFLIILLGLLFSAVTLAGALVGYVRSYNRFFRFKNLPPRLYPLKPINRVAMAIGIAVAWLVVVALYNLIVFVLHHLGFNAGAVTAILLTNLIFCGIVFGTFQMWKISIENKLIEETKFGSARFARQDELVPLRTNKGYYIGWGLHYFERGHLLTVGGTRGGKGANIIVPNLLGAGEIETSWVIIDPKGENCSISQKYQRSTGKNVVILNPWGLLESRVGQAQSYNPLDMLSDKSSPHLVDDVQMLAEMIVPVDAASSDPFWSDSARTIISGLLLHLVMSQPQQDRHLGTLWKWARLFGDDWNKLIQDMGASDDPVNGVVVENAANEILKLSAAGDETFGSIVSNVLQATDFLKSPLLQKSLQSGFDPKVLAEGNTVLYVIIPADKLRAYSRWLRLVTTSMMRAVIRKPNKRVTFLLDEFAALGYLPEIETALSTYAGFNVTVWPILQSLIQLQALYGKNWQSFIANCNVRQYLSINDNESGDYISAAIGQTSNTITRGRTRFNIGKAESNARALITPDELRRESGKKIFMFVGDLPPTYIEKKPYYSVPEWDNRADKNPYFN